MSPGRNRALSESKKNSDIDIVVDDLEKVDKNVESRIEGGEA